MMDQRRLCILLLGLIRLSMLVANVSPWYWDGGKAFDNRNNGGKAFDYNNGGNAADYNNGANAADYNNGGNAADYNTTVTPVANSPTEEEEMSVSNENVFEPSATELKYWRLVKQRSRGYYKPSLAAVTRVSDFCRRKAAGSYGNPNYQCVIYHVCQHDGDIIRYDTLPCPQGLKFNDRLRLCDWNYNVDEYCNSIKKPSIFRKAPDVDAVPHNNSIRLDIRVYDRGDGNNVLRQTYHRYAETKMRDRITRVPYYFRQQSRMKAAPTTRQALPYFEVAYPAYLGYKKSRQSVASV